MPVVLASGSPDALNGNPTIMADLAQGFRDECGADAVLVSPFQDVADHVLRTRPEFLLMIGSAFPDTANYREVANACRAAGSRFAFWTTEDPYEFDVHRKFSRYADVVFTNDAYAATFYDRADVHHLPLAASEDRRRPLTAFESRPLDVFFCGVAFANRRMFVNDALPVLRRHRCLIVGDGWTPTADGMISGGRLPASDLADYHAASRFTLTLGRSSFLANRSGLQPVTPAPRTFEAAMAGCVQLYHRPSCFLRDYFTPGEEIVTFDTVAEFESKLEHLKAHPGQAEEIAAASQRRALAEHTYRHRARTILSTMGL